MIESFFRDCSIIATANQQINQLNSFQKSIHPHSGISEARWGSFTADSSASSPRLVGMDELNFEMNQSNVRNKRRRFSAIFIQEGNQPEEKCFFLFKIYTIGFVFVFEKIFCNFPIIKLIEFQRFKEKKKKKKNKKREQRIEWEICTSKTRLGIQLFQIWRQFQTFPFLLLLPPSRPFPSHPRPSRLPPPQWRHVNEFISIWKKKKFLLMRDMRIAIQLWADRPISSSSSSPSSSSGFLFHSFLN